MTMPEENRERSRAVAETAEYRNGSTSQPREEKILMRTMFDRFLRISSMFMLMMSLVHCDALDFFGDDEIDQ